MYGELTTTDHLLEPRVRLTVGNNFMLSVVIGFVGAGAHALVLELCGILIDSPFR